jgi:hypothetical protein
MLWDDGQIPDVHFHKRVSGPGGVGIEHDQLVRPPWFIGVPGDVDALGGVLLAEERSLGKAGEGEDELLTWRSLSHSGSGSGIGLAGTCTRFPTSGELGG